MKTKTLSNTCRESKLILLPLYVTLWS